MKKRTLIILLILIVAILFVPVPSSPCKDGGTRDYTSMTYKIVVWNHICDDGNVFQETKVYFFPDNFRSMDDLIDRELSQ